MRLSKKYRVPKDIALLYEFANSLDERKFVEGGVVHEEQDELADVSRLASWLQQRGSSQTTPHLQERDLRAIQELRAALREYIRLDPGKRAGNAVAAARFNEAAAQFPLVFHLSKSGVPELAPRTSPHQATLAEILAEFYQLAVQNRLHRLKMCASEECRWIFYDQSRPGTRRWCSSSLCGNRHKTRSYRERKRQKGVE